MSQRALAKLNSVVNHTVPSVDHILSNGSYSENQSDTHSGIEKQISNHFFRMLYLCLCRIISISIQFP